MRILCFGDSNTYGYHTVTGGRFDKRTRWTGRLQKMLGSEHRVIDEGLNGRMTVFEDPFLPGRCGLDDIDTIMGIHDPIDLLIVMLGTNDCKNTLRVSAEQIALGVEQVIEKAKATTEQLFQILLISPIAIGEDVVLSGFGWEFDQESMETAAGLADEIQRVAERQGALFLDASKVAEPCRADGIHLDELGHERLAKAVLEVVESCIFS